ncbi:MAG: hypothetical protein RR559_00040 [Bacteroides sp.]
MTKNLVISTDDNTSTSKRDETNACYINPGHVPEVYFEGQKIAVIKMEYTWTTQSEKDIGLDIAVVHGYADGQTIERTFLLDFKTNVTTEAPTSTIVDQFREQYPWIYISKIIEIDPLTLRVETHNPKDTILAVYDLETKRFNIDWCISSVDESMCDDQLADLENI